MRCVQNTVGVGAAASAPRVAISAKSDGRRLVSISTTGCVPGNDFEKSLRALRLVRSGVSLITLKLASLRVTCCCGTPYFTARNTLWMCEDIPCVKACPAVRSIPALWYERCGMGTATVLIDKRTAAIFKGTICDVCYRISYTAIDKAIILKLYGMKEQVFTPNLFPPIHADYCTGCGKCEETCVLDVAAIKWICQQACARSVR